MITLACQLKRTMMPLQTIIKCLSALLLITLVGACKQRVAYNREDGLAAITEAGFEEHLKTLSSDEFLGRMPFTPGETKTIAYLQDQLEEMGLEPGLKLRHKQIH